ncbi:hypothetical protein QE152_g10161 [Popillia japonica]|uniref:Retrotransposon gag domain-containing protein n=1 Tax=Popillia japonica TaxID=7064 RepID=A0AAW1LVY2_POPJA
MERLNDSHKLIEWECELLRRERELLQREREILNGTLNQSQVQSVSPAVAKKKEIADMIPEFNPSKLSSLSLNQWVRKTESIGSAYSLDGTTLALHAAMKLCGAARLWHDGALDCATTWDRFNCAFLGAFPTSTNEADVHAKLMRRKKRHMKNIFMRWLPLQKR